MDTTKPHPQRFQSYTMLPGGRSFTIKDCKFVFKLDRFGGWKDQYGHYYNQDGQPDYQPEDAQLTPSEGSVEQGDHYDDYNEFEPDYPHHEDDHRESIPIWQINRLERLAKNLQTLSTYPAGKMLRIYYEQMSYKVSAKGIFDGYSAVVPGIVNVIAEEVEGRRNGEGYFVMSDAKKAEVLVKMDNQKMFDRQVYYFVESLDELIMDPLRQNEIKPSWAANSQTWARRPDVKAEPKVEENKQKPAEVKKPEPKKQEPTKPAQKVVEQKKQEQAKPKNPEPEFRVYQLNFEIFPKKSDFHTFIAKYGINKDTDIKKINKQEKDGKTKITIEIKTAAVAKLANTKYEGKEVKFIPEAI